jgi:hypothetical protein
VRLNRFREIRRRPEVRQAVAFYEPLGCFGNCWTKNRHGSVRLNRFGKIRRRPEVRQALAFYEPLGCFGTCWTINLFVDESQQFSRLCKNKLRGAAVNLVLWF